MLSDHGNAVEEGEGRGEGRGGLGRALKEEEEEDERRMHCLCTIGDSRRSSICMRREKEAAWNGGVLEQHCRCR